MSNLDRTFCASPNCNNECGRKMNSFDLQVTIQCKRSISYAYFCGEPKNLDRFTKLCLKRYGEENDKV